MNSVEGETFTVTWNATSEGKLQTVEITVEDEVGGSHWEMIKSNIRTQMVCLKGLARMYFLHPRCIIVKHS